MKFLLHCLLVSTILLHCHTNAQTVAAKITVPLGGNSWLSVKASDGEEGVTNKGWENWQHPDAVWSTFIKIPRAGKLRVSADIMVPEGESQLKWTINGIGKTIKTGGAGKVYEIGEWDILQPGYVKIDACGISKTGQVFANINEIQIDGTATEGRIAFVKNNEGNYFYWGRRGPSVHINYDLSEVNDDIEWFYSEITVPAGNDVIGSYFMANGFAEGYFGMQVNSPTERRILFSVWSPFVTDDPKEIPADKKIVLINKGKQVYTGEFGHEGSGGQSYLQYNWRAGQTYRFLVQAKPVENNYTTYTAYFCAPEKKQWFLIASFSRPETTTYLKRLHSFLENFEPETGNISRKAWYHNPWVRTKAGEWKLLTKMLFTGDATAKIGYRDDYAGGVENDKFYLRNCGFFNNNTLLKTEFYMASKRTKPRINLVSLPN